MKFICLLFSRRDPVPRFWNATRMIDGSSIAHRPVIQEFHSNSNTDVIENLQFHTSGATDVITSLQTGIFKLLEFTRIIRISEQ